MSKKATHYGECQACGSVQKLPNSVLSNHGYTVKWGFFSGTCLGAGKAPYEESCDLLKHFIANAQKQKESFLEQIEQIKNNTSNKAWFHHYVAGQGGGQRIWKEAEVNNGSIQYEAEKLYTVSALRHCIHGSDIEIAKELNNKKIKWIEKNIKQVEEYIKWQEERINNWEVKALEPIK